MLYAFLECIFRAIVWSVVQRVGVIRVISFVTLPSC